jgi:hypothetical protein
MTTAPEQNPPQAQETGTRDVAVAERCNPVTRQSALQAIFSCAAATAGFAVIGGARTS